MQPIAQYAARSNDLSVLLKSSSGGLFTELARTVLSRGGIVFGSSWDKITWKPVHKSVDNDNGLGDLRGSKYVASDISPVFSELEKNIRIGRETLFVGTPCQIAAVRKRFGYAENLYLCGLFCRNNVPYNIWRMYLDEVEESAKSKITNVCFRDKHFKWPECGMSIEFENPAKNMLMPAGENVYMQLFFSCWASNESCIKCQFRSGKSGADLLIGDFWGLPKSLSSMNDGKGVSAVLVYTEQGMALLEAANIQKFPVDYSQVLAENPRIEIQPEVDIVRRNRFQQVWKSKKLSSAIRYAEWGPLPVEIALKCYFRCRCFLRALLRRVGIK